MTWDPKKPELRQDLVTGDWIILAAERSKRPDQVSQARIKRKRAPKKGCPFEDPHEEVEPSLIYFTDRKKKDWRVQIIQNKYPLLWHHTVCSGEANFGPYRHATGVGQHDVVITRDHDKNFPALSKKDARLVFRAFIERYKDLAKDPCINYFFALHNWGSGAGASIYHPHYQIVAFPVVPPDINRSLLGSKSYFRKHKRCPHCDMIAWERKQKQRIVFENKNAIAFAPYASRFAFEIKVMPKRHLPYFEDTPKDILDDVVEVLQKTLKAITKKLGDPDYNFYIHTSPLKNKKSYTSYHWHIEVLTKMTVIASLEIGTGMEVNIVHPSDAAKILRKK